MDKLYKNEEQSDVRSILIPDGSANSDSYGRWTYHFFYLYYLPIIPDDDHVVVGIDRVRDTQLRERGFENGSLMALVAHPQSHAHARFQ